MTDSSATASKLNLEAYISVAKVRPNISPLKIGELQPVVSAFSTNYTALQRMLLLPALIAYGVAHLQNTYDHAELEVRGSLSKSGPSEPLIEPNPEISKRFLELYRQQLEENQRVLGTEEWDRKATVALQSGFQAVEFLLNHADILPSIQSMLASHIVAMWTIFETLAGDLWEAALNYRPQGLAELAGEKRYRRPKKSISSVDTQQDKIVRLKFIREQNWDTRNKMGTIYILSDRFGFKSLQGIRDAYEAAFYKDSDFIDKFIQQDCLDRRSAFRNVIVHRAAIADAEYVQITRNVTTLPKLEIGEKLRLDAQMVGSLVHETAVVCRFLIYFVDKWLDDNAIKVGEDEQ